MLRKKGSRGFILLCHTILILIIDFLCNQFSMNIGLWFEGVLPAVFWKNDVNGVDTSFLINSKNRGNGW